jgi:phosphoribosylamine--glycine ligase
MKVLVVGGGGREHALAWRLRQDDPRIELYAAPGNPGMTGLATCVPIGATQIDALVAFARQERIAWTLVGPEIPLSLGIADAFAAAGLAVFGPTQAAARIESSKSYSKTLMMDAGVPTARAAVCTTLDEAHRAIDEIGAPVVVKASGLAAGKGVIICATADDARVAADGMLAGGSFGDAGETVLIEEFMEGEELSLFVLTDGERVLPLPAAQDHKRLLDGDRGPNTGGMGAYCPVSLGEQSPSLVSDVLDTIVRPTLGIMRERGTPFSGLLYVGLMLTATGPRVVEFNCRYGDPETQAVLPAIAPSAPLAGLMELVARGERLPEDVDVSATRCAVTTVLAADGYPEHPRKGDIIELPATPPDVLVFHAGTTRRDDGRLVTAGGRVLAVTGVADSLGKAQQRSQAFAGSVRFAGRQFRTDIGWRELERRAGVT